jgi:hypothetical protein
VRAVALAILSSVVAASTASAQTWSFHEETNPETKAVFRSASLDAPDRQARLILACERRPWNRWGTIYLSIEFARPFRSNALIQVLNRLSDDDKATTLQMSQSGKTLFTSDQDEVVRLGNGFATHSRWSMHANDRSATFDLPRDGKPIAEFIAWCQEEKT